MITKVVRHEENPDVMWLIYFEYRSASANIATLGDQPEYAHLYDLYSKNRGKGEASALLKEIHEYCLRERISLVIRAEVFDQGTDGIQTNDELRAWYEKNGAIFVEYDPAEGHAMLLMGYPK